MTTPDRSEQMAEALAAIQKVIEALPAQMRYSMSLTYIEQLRKMLDKMVAKEDGGEYTLLDIHAQALDAMEMSIKQHQITWEHQHGQQA